jgi:hypothetical protein
LGIDPHWILWNYLFHLCRSGSLAKIPELGGAIVSVRSESQYLEFKMAQSVQGWRQKWFYIKDQKFSDSDQYGLAPIDASKGLIHPFCITILYHNLLLFINIFHI